ncbi:MAG TPA: DinB family protein [Gemmatimonadales bacterium]
MTLEVLRRLFAHLRWADRQVLEALGHAPGTHAGRALALYAHVLGAEHVWLARLQQEPATVAVWPAFTLAECAVLAEQTHAALDGYLAHLSEAALTDEVGYVNSAGQSFRSSVEDILLHVALHGSYHRGQVALLVRDGGGTPAPTDFIGFVRGAPAATRVDR